jgi:hypothetical protein
MDEERFEELYRSAVRFRRVSPQLRLLLHEVYRGIVTRPADLGDVRNALESLLSFLSSRGGRTDANCCATDALFSAADRWEHTWSDLPRELAAILDDIGGTLHDAVYAPHIAANFETLPEQLLQRVRSIR